MTPRILLGLPPALRDQAAWLYWQAFGPKLGRVMGPEPRALAYLARILRDDHVIIAHDGPLLLGLAGFRTPQGSFAVGDGGDLAALYGALGGAWRGWLMARLSSEVDNVNFLVDGICVHPAHRGQGIGTALIAALAGEARLRGYPALRLDVVEANTRARALYARQGFVQTKVQPTGWLAPIFGFRAAITMVRPL